MLDRLKPYWLHAYLLTYTPLLLLADSRITALWQQWALGLLTFALLYLAALKAPKEQRMQVWICVGVATGFEIFGSLIWGVYRYRLHNVPLFVPPGHGLVYLFGLLAARTPVVMKYGRRVGRVILASASLWAVAGLTVLPLITGRVDLQGALCLPRAPLTAVAAVRRDLHRHRRAGDIRHVVRQLVLAPGRPLDAYPVGQPTIRDRRRLLRDRRLGAAGHARGVCAALAAPRVRAAS